MLYNFWNCLGSLDGKHIKIKSPSHSGALYYNYKGFYSIVLMALVNARKEFIMIDIGTNGRISDGGVLFYTKFWEKYQRNDLNLPAPSTLPNTLTKYPYVFVADEAFALGQNLMKPYAQKSCNAEEIVFNNRLSSARQTVECCFGQLASRFRIFLTTINLEPTKATIVTTACCYLHNFLLKENSNYYTPSNSVNGNEIISVAPTFNRNATNTAKTVRDSFCKYFSNEGKI
jgi:DDE superfamily endonuclease